MFRKILTFIILLFSVLNQVYAYSGDLIPPSQPSSFQEEGVGQETGTGEVESGTGNIEELEVLIEETNSGVIMIETSSGATQENGSGIVEVDTVTGSLDEYSSRFKIIFQNPSYLLDKDLELNSYTCDDSQDECKVNFNIDDLELSTFSTKFYCSIDFGFVTGEEDKCNPSTVIFGTRIHDVNFQIFLVEDNSLIWEKNVEIINEKISSSQTYPIVEETLELGSGSTNTGSGETNSGTIEVGTGEEIIPPAQPSHASWEEGVEQGSGSIDTGTGEVLSGVILEIPEPFIEVQSGLNYLTGNIWQCNKESCKINLTGESSFTGIFLQSNYECLWSFSGGSFSTAGTQNKCNPGYVDYGTGEYEVSFKIYEKGNLENFKQSFISLQNINENDEIEIGTGEEVIPPSQPSPLQEEGVGQEIGTGEIYISTGIIQTGSGLENSGTGSIKIDLNLDVGIGGEYTGSGEQVIKSGRSGGGSGGGSNYIQEKEILIQSGLDYINGIYQCSEERCKINLEYKDNSKETCLWDFGGGEYKEKYTTTCNPGFLYYESGNYRITLQVYNDGILSKTKILVFKNTYLDNLRKDNKRPKSKILLQGTLAKYKELNEDKLICKDVEECSVNLSGEESIDENLKTLAYEWDFGNGETFEGDNPLTIKYKPGKYAISLKVTDLFGETDTTYFYVEVIGKTIIPDLVIDQNIFSNLKISGILPNNSSVDDYEWVELENTGNVKLNLKGVFIDDIVGKGSRAYSINQDLILQAHKKKRFYKSKTRLSLGNTIDEVNILYNKIIVDNLSRDFKVPDDFVITHENVDRPLQKVFVKRVVDGDTMDIVFESGKEERLRLIGVDTPETKHPKKPVEEFGIEAYNFTKDNLEGKHVFLETGIDERGKYGRLLAYVYLDENSSFNEILIEKGYARAYLKYPFKYSKMYASLEKIAKKNKVGLWGNKEVLEVIKDWKEEDEEYLEELEKEELYDFSEIFLNGLNVDEIKRKSGLIKNDLSSRFESTKKNISFKSDWFSMNKTKAKNIDKVAELEKELKSSISYKVSKQKKGLKITGNSKEYKEIILLFDGKKINLKADDNGDFNYYTSNINPGDYTLEFYGVDSSIGDIFLKNSRTISLAPEYVENMKTYKVKSSSKSSSTKPTKPLKLNIIPEISNSISPDKNQIPFVLNILLGFLVLLFMFLVLRKKGIV